MSELKIGDIVEAKIKNVKPYAAFLLFPNGKDGLLHISEISDGFVKDIERYVSVGDSIRVKIISIDKRNGFMRVSLKQVPEESRFSTHKNQRRKVVKNSSEDFAPLKEKLNYWIAESLKENNK